MGGWRAYSFICTVLLHPKSNCLTNITPILRFHDDSLGIAGETSTGLSIVIADLKLQKKTIICTFLSGENQTLNL